MESKANKFLIIFSMLALAFGCIGYVFTKNYIFLIIGVSISSLLFVFGTIFTKA